MGALFKLVSLIRFKQMHIITIVKPTHEAPPLACVQRPEYASSIYQSAIL